MTGEWCGQRRRCLMAMLLTVGGAGLAFGQSTTVSVDDLVATQAGDLPIILSAPHGGTLEIPGVAPRETEGLPKGGTGYVVGRDTGTEELARAVAAAIEQRFGKKPYFVFSRAHRKYLDPNRPPEIAYDDEDAKPVYDHYHRSVESYCRDVREKFHGGLLLDIHGQGTAKDTVFRGTKNGKTVVLLRERFGEVAHAGPDCLFSLLKTQGWKVHPDPFDGKEQAGFTGGHIVQTYGSHQGHGIDAVQLEFGMEYRAKESHAKTAAALAEAVGDYAERYLSVKPLDIIDVAVYSGEGTSNNLSKLLQALDGQSKIIVKQVLAEDICAGRLAGCEVVIHPGGSGSQQSKALGEEGRRKVREFVEAGGGYIGVCAGAYLATCEYDWSLRILDAKVIDRAHWNRGFGSVEISLSDRGRELLGITEPRVSIYYHQGPLLAPANDPAVADYDGLARFETEIAKNGAPQGVMPGATAIASGVHRKGRVLCFSPHPERTEGLERLLPRAVEWASGAERN